MATGFAARRTLSFAGASRLDYAPNKSGQYERSFLGWRLHHAAPEQRVT